MYFYKSIHDPNAIIYMGKDKFENEGKLYIRTRRETRAKNKRANASSLLSFPTESES
jgi:hypothetical protein